MHISLVLSLFRLENIIWLKKVCGFSHIQSCIILQWESKLTWPKRGRAFWWYQPIRWCDGVYTSKDTAPSPAWNAFRCHRVHYPRLLIMAWILDLTTLYNVHKPSHIENQSTVYRSVWKKLHFIFLKHVETSKYHDKFEYGWGLLKGNRNWRMFI